MQLWKGEIYGRTSFNMECNVCTFNKFIFSDEYILKYRWIFTVNYPSEKIFGGIRRKWMLSPWNAKVNRANFNAHFSAECGQLGRAGQPGSAGQLGHIQRSCFSTEKCQFTQCKAVLFSAETTTKNSVVSFSAEKCQFTPCIAIFFSAKSINFFQ